MLLQKEKKNIENKLMQVTEKISQSANSKCIQKLWTDRLEDGLLLGDFPVQLIPLSHQLLRVLQTHPAMEKKVK